MSLCSVRAVQIFDTYVSEHSLQAANLAVENVVAGYPLYS